MSGACKGPGAALYDPGVGIAAHGGTVGLILEVVPAFALAAIGVAVWLRDRRRHGSGAAGQHEAAVEQQRGDG
jgi:hypothetical protein